MAVIEAVVVEGSLQYSGILRVHVTKRLLLILDLVDSDPHDDGPVRSCSKALGVNGLTHIAFFFAPDDLEFVLFVQGCTHRGHLGSFCV